MFDKNKKIILIECYILVLIVLAILSIFLAFKISQKKYNAKYTELEQYYAEKENELNNTLASKEISSPEILPEQTSSDTYSETLDSSIEDNEQSEIDELGLIQEQNNEQTIPFVDITFEKIGKQFSTYHQENAGWNGFKYNERPTTDIIYKQYFLNQSFKCDEFWSDYNETPFQNTSSSSVGVKNDVIVIDYFGTQLPEQLSSVTPYIIETYSDKPSSSIGEITLIKIGIWQVNNGYAVIYTTNKQDSIFEERMLEAVVTSDLRYLYGMDSIPQGNSNQ